MARDLADLQQRYIDSRISRDTEARLAAIEARLEHQLLRPGGGLPPLPMPGPGIDPDACIPVLREAFTPRNIAVSELLRGQGA